MVDHQTAPPILEAPQQPVASKSLSRSKTMRNTANKVSRFFKKQAAVKEVSPTTEQQQQHPRSLSSTTSSSQHGWDRASIPSTFMNHSVNDISLAPRPVSSYYHGETTTDSSSDIARPLSAMTDLAPTTTTTTTATTTCDMTTVNSTAANTTTTTTTATPLHRDDAVENDHSNDEELSSEAEDLLRELDHVNAAVASMQKQVQSEAEQKQALQAQVEEIRRQIQAEELEQQQIEHRLFESTRAIRATDDDLSTIRDSFKLMKYGISRLVMTLNKKADRHTATNKFKQLWPQMLENQNEDLESSQINLLAEKLIHQHLVNTVFECPLYPGVDVNDAFAAVSTWLVSHDSVEFPVRLRQQLAAIIAKSSKESEVQMAAKAERDRITQAIYNDLADVYSPFLKENDKGVDEEKRYYAKVGDIVDKAMRLAIAMRGQDVEIVTKGAKEGEDQFNEETMVDVKGKTSGVVRFCICPAFIGGDGEHGFLEKGKVVLA
ncbi:hypothetical protein RO3G_00668 [Lichtheimia corymbifera JMRC:FSU:9682]|uniref:Uncharacterized protein n=1 Tax=Lichtheimia corymbifera JMRC:FSU:9682 TaxID=1263082 RepID=A0A068RUZ3_9FUNG|nr:hypothetical protein RO3G_00668 [Lichtheimia corymbifera JMRC:FSU:9682]